MAAANSYDIFIEDLVDNYWEKKPGVFRSPFGKPLVESEELVGLVPELAEDEGEAVLLMSEQTNPVQIGDHFTGVFPQLSGQSDLESLVLETLRTHQGNELFCYFSNIQRFHGELWCRLWPVLRRLFDRAGIPGNRIELDMFLGRYDLTPSGIHKDSASLGFVTTGTKRVLVWPYETFLDVPGLKEADPYSETAYFLGDRVKLEDWRDKAIVLEGEPGDILYWPSHYWHIGEGLGKVTSMVTLAFFIPDNLSRVFERSFQRAYLDKKRQHTTRKIDVGFDEETLCYTGIEESENRARRLNAELDKELEKEFELLTRANSLRASMLGFGQPPVFKPLSFRKTETYALVDEGTMGLYRSEVRFEIHASGRALPIKKNAQEILELLKGLRDKKSICWEQIEVSGSTYEDTALAVLTFLLNRRVLSRVE